MFFKEFRKGEEPIFKASTPFLKQRPYFLQQLHHLQIDRRVDVEEMVVDSDPVFFAADVGEAVEVGGAGRLEVGFPVQGFFRQGEAFAAGAQDALVADEEYFLVFFREEKKLPRIAELVDGHGEKIRIDGFLFVGKIEVIKDHLKEIDVLQVGPLVSEDGFGQGYAVDVPAVADDENIEQFVERILQVALYPGAIGGIVFFLFKLLGQLPCAPVHRIPEAGFIKPLGIFAKFARVVLRLDPLFQGHEKPVGDLPRDIASEVDAKVRLLPRSRQLGRAAMETELRVGRKTRPAFRALFHHALK
jgi:hypothetical protein